MVLYSTRTANNMKIDVFIMAGGEQVRWKDNTIKQLSLVDNAKWTVIQRVFALVKKYLNCEPIVVTKNIDISLNTGCYSNPDLCAGTLCESMSRCIEISENDGILFLLGDVYYTRTAFDNILRVNRPYFGSEVELFASKFPKSHYERALNTLYYAVELNQDDPDIYKGKMWNMYYLWAGYNSGGHDFGKDFGLIEDNTCDFDTVDEYNEFIKKGVNDWFKV